MNKQQWENLVDAVRDMAASIAREDEHQPMVHILVNRDPLTGEPLDSARLCVLPGAFVGANDDEVQIAKAQFVSAARALACAGDATGAVVVVETWAAAQDELEPGQRPKDNPAAREERLLIATEHREHGLGASYARIYREEGQRRLDAFEPMPGIAHSIFHPLLAPPDADDSLRQLARDYLAKFGYVAAAAAEPGDQ